ncbi:acetylornithine transaminase [Bacillus sp. AFS053548]|uniref:acetylornithine transaminase n=1 Tax=Bacillus sp. AFS053548 TaxID=2033505 RepID=UPI000BFB79BE|nr:acetylornithine transaminase [Bacillus sp. AFS053548]PGM59556.1 aspartate aminotransferase family protein [Bacillus sp. AFS053548]
MSNLFPTYNKKNINFQNGKGTYLYDDENNKYLDFLSGIAVCNLGHCHPKVVNALKEQVESIWHVSNLFTIKKQEELAKVLVKSFKDGLVFFCNSGTEANEAAIKLARKHSGKSHIISFKQSFHGRTFGSMAATGQSKIHEGYGEMLSGFTYVPYNDLNALQNEVNENTGAIILEVIQGEGGVVVGNNDFFEGVQALCEKHELLLIVDEVQTGVGRTGTMFAYEQTPLNPDIITLAKGLGNGFPVGAMLGKKKLANTFSLGAHGSTFGGNYLAMAAAYETINIINDLQFLKSVKDKGQYLVDKLAEIKEEFPQIVEIRGKGLMVGIELNLSVDQLVEQFLKNGLIVGTAGPNVLRLLPPINLSYEEIDEAIQIMKQVLSSYFLDSQVK